LVPSRYALRVGEIDVLVISDGVLPISAPTLATNADPADLAAWLDDMFLPPDVLEWPLNVVVVRRGGQTVLIDAGLGVEFPDFPRNSWASSNYLCTNDGLETGVPRRALRRSRRTRPTRRSKTTPKPRFS
jgi:hypothetical protein